MRAFSYRYGPFPASSVVMPSYQLTINGTPQVLEVDSDMPLLWALRDVLGLVGTKFGCGIAQCGACTVQVNDVAMRSCVVRVSDIAGQSVRTIEGLADDGGLHPLQQAFVDHDALQCGFCTPGMIMNAYGLLEGEKAPSRSRINDAMEDNLCRCGAHKRIVAAIESVAEKMAKEAKS